MSNLILSRGPCPRPSLEFGIESPRVGLEGIYTVQLIDSATGKIKQEYKSKNVLTDAFMNFIGTATASTPLIGAAWNTANAAIKSLLVGTGSTTPATTDTGLASALSGAAEETSIAAESGYTSGTPDYHWYRTWRDFSEAQVNGNLTEMGFFDKATSGTLMSRQLIKDSGGTPITITKTSSDRLRVGYELRAYPPMADVTGSITLDGVSYSYTLRPNAVGIVDVFGDQWGTFLRLGLSWSANLAYASRLGTNPTLTARTVNTEATGAGTASDSSSVLYSTYSAGDFYRDQTLTWDPLNGNVTGGIGYFTLFRLANSGALWKGMFSTKIPKNNTKRLILTFRHSWGRVTI